MVPSQRGLLTTRGSYNRLLSAQLQLLHLFQEVTFCFGEARVAMVTICGSEKVFLDASCK